MPVLNKICRFSPFRSRDWFNFLAEKEAASGRLGRKRIVCTQVRPSQQGVFGDTGSTAVGGRDTDPKDKDVVSVST